MTQAIWMIVVGCGLAVASGLLVGWLKHWLIAKQLVDVPEARKNHDRIVPRGAGLVLVPLMLFGWLMVHIYVGGDVSMWVVMAAVMLLALGAWDDRFELRAKPKLLVQLLAVFIAMPAMDALEFLPLLPAALWWAVVFLAWVWWLNLFNFMDGMDGISAWQVVVLCGMLGLLSMASILPAWLGACAAVMAAVMMGFYRWNHHPAHIFLGDAGSLPIGFLLGYLLLELVLAGYWWLALLLPLYYWADASITLVKRFLQGKNIAQAHSEHWYQRALRAGLGHKAVLLHMVIAYLVKTAFLAGWLMELYDLWVLAGAIIISVVALMGYWSYIIGHYDAKKR